MSRYLHWGEGCVEGVGGPVRLLSRGDGCHAMEEGCPAWIGVQGGEVGVGAGVLKVEGTVFDGALRPEDGVVIITGERKAAGGVVLDSVAIGWFCLEQDLLLDCLDVEACAISEVLARVGGFGLWARSATVCTAGFVWADAVMTSESRRRKGRSGLRSMELLYAGGGFARETLMATGGWGGRVRRGWWGRC